MQTEMVPTESDVSFVRRARVGPRRRIEVFSGDDPMFNIHNLKLRIYGMERKHVIYLSLLLLMFTMAVSAVLVWFKVVLKGYAD